MYFFDNRRQRNGRSQPRENQKAQKNKFDCYFSLEKIGVKFSDWLARNHCCEMKKKQIKANGGEKNDGPL
ncbi:hypothetical protein GWI33_004216 [Rhynchophorus ferrugineus]|uniref:Uncharacterized protein n=1 Tax=Rhynchophorus ferrugineus TaxID=354439 RepID=A0A834IQH2_RHYFE|nr:hypothetical protein GWI33_004216 [Rhynchophorus ferrugineus]